MRYPPYMAATTKSDMIRKRSPLGLSFTHRVPSFVTSNGGITLVAVVAAAELSAAIRQRLPLRVQAHRADHLRWDMSMVVSPPHLQLTPTPARSMTLTSTLQVVTTVWRIIMGALGMHLRHNSSTIDAIDVATTPSSHLTSLVPFISLLVRRNPACLTSSFCQRHRLRFIRGPMPQMRAPSIQVGQCYVR